MLAQQIRAATKLITDFMDSPAILVIPSIGYTAQSRNHVITAISVNHSTCSNGVTKSQSMFKCSPEFSGHRLISKEFLHEQSRQTRHRRPRPLGQSADP